MTITRKILEGTNIKDLAWCYKGFLNDCLPKHLVEEALGWGRPETILARIDDKQKQLDALNNIPEEELVEKKISNYYKWMNEVEGNLTDEQKLMREKCNKTITELRKWEPASESSKHLKTKLIELIKENVEWELYEWMNHPEHYNFEFAKGQIIKNRKELEDAIAYYKRKYLISVEYYNESDLLESQLLKDLEQLV